MSRGQMHYVYGVVTCHVKLFLFHVFNYLYPRLQKRLEINIVIKAVKMEDIFSVRVKKK